MKDCLADCQKGGRNVGRIRRRPLESSTASVVEKKIRRCRSKTCRIGRSNFGGGEFGPDKADRAVESETFGDDDRSRM